MGSPIVGRTKCPECQFEAAHVKRSPRCLYRHCPTCGAMYHATGAARESALLDKTRPEPGPQGEGRAGAPAGGAPTPTPTQAPAPAASGEGKPAAGTPTPTPAPKRPGLGLFGALTR